jgi:hypothetical protein
MLRHTFTHMILAGAALTVTAQAQDFSADMVVNGLSGKVSDGKFYHTATKIRYDSTITLPAMGKQPARVKETHMITDREQRLIFLVEPQEKVILVNYALQIADKAGFSGDSSCSELSKAAGAVVSMKGASNCKQIGSDTVNGRATTMWEMQIGMGIIQLGKWTVWIDPQLKTAIKWRSGNETTGELLNIQMGPQPASLFVLPADYRRQDLPH